NSARVATWPWARSPSAGRRETPTASGNTRPANTADAARVEASPGGGEAKRTGDQHPTIQCNTTCSTPRTASADYPDEPSPPSSLSTRPVTHRATHAQRQIRILRRDTEDAAVAHAVGQILVVLSG